ncbi:MAG: DUF956 family protein [Anaerococcus sp.]|nr:DUF956 family protein [Anaerococcus sp.]MDD7045417.1 DUF956 family protein [Peptoniphilaceae bacterium]MDY2918127.1 DUF956 family protein [Anaerococcus sp.]
MIRSQNTKADLTIKASNLNGFTSNGKALIGDKAFEYYNSRNGKDYIQIPYKEIDYISAEVLFGKKIVRFAIHTKANGTFKFSTRDNKKTLRAINKYVDSEKLRRSLSFIELMKRGVKNLIKKIKEQIK